VSKLWKNKKNTENHSFRCFGEDTPIQTAALLNAIAREVRTQ
jgi:hypothetical protein